VVTYLQQQTWLKKEKKGYVDGNGFPQFGQKVASWATGEPQLGQYRVACVGCDAVGGGGESP